MPSSIHPSCGSSSIVHESLFPFANSGRNSRSCLASYLPDSCLGPCCSHCIQQRKAAGGNRLPPPPPSRPLLFRFSLVSSPPRFPPSNSTTQFWPLSLHLLAYTQPAGALVRFTYATADLLAGSGSVSSLTRPFALFSTPRPSVSRLLTAILASAARLEIPVSPTPAGSRFSLRHPL